MSKSQFKKSIAKRTIRDEEASSKTVQAQDYIPPNDQQLFNFVKAHLNSVSLIMPSDDFIRRSLQSPVIKDRWLSYHRSFVMNLTTSGE